MKHLKSSFKLFIIFTIFFLSISLSHGASGVITTTLRYGMKDIQVKYLQETLNEKGYTVATTGIGSKGQESTYFGPATLNAVKAYQRAHNLTADGIFGAKSRATTLSQTITTTNTSTTNNNTSYKQGCTATTLYSATTGLPCKETSNTSLPTGCTSTSLYSAITGQRCNQTTTTTTYKPGCTATTLYSRTTGLSCTTNTTTGGGTTGGGGGGGSSSGGGSKGTDDKKTSNTPPTILISTNNTTFTSPASITISATASDSDGTISKVDFYNGSTLLYTDTTSPYTFAWTSVPTGTYTLKAVATDNSNASTTSSTITVNVSTVDEDIFIQAENASYGGGTSIENNNLGFNGSGFINFPLFGGYLQFNNIDGDSGGEKTLAIRYALSTSANPLPPRTGILVVNGISQPITFSSSGSSFSSWAQKIVSINLKSNSTNIIRFETNGQDLANIDEISISSLDHSNTPPTISISTSKTSFTAPANITISATASDTDGTISKVDFYNGSTLLYTDTTSPYTFSWTSVPTGTYTLKAVATDNSNASTTSSSTTVTVSGINTAVITNVYASDSEAGNPPEETLDRIFSDTSRWASEGNGKHITYELSKTTTVSYIRLAFFSTSSRYFDIQYSINNTTWNNIATSLVSTANMANQYQRFNFTPVSAKYIRIVGHGSSAPSLWNSIVETDINGFGINLNTTPPPSNTSPTISISTNNTSFTTPANITISATASDSDGTISKVDFYNGSTLLYTDTTSPYTFAWTLVPTGTYTLKAIATDNSNANTTSSTITVNVVVDNTESTTCARTFYISNSQGNDSNTGTSASTPIKTLAKLQTMLDNSQAGDCYLLKRGDVWTERANVATAYAGKVGLNLANADGNINNLLIIGDYGAGNLPTFDFSGTGSSIFFEGANHLLVKNLKITSTDSNLKNRPTVGIHSVGSLGGGFHFVTFDGIDVDGVVQPARVQEADSSDNFILQNSFLRNGANEAGLDANTSNSNGIFMTTKDSKILNNKIYNNGEQDSQLYLMSNKNLLVAGNEIHDGAYGFHISNPVDVVIKDNKIYNTDLGIYVGTRNYGVEPFQAKNVTLDSNEIYNSVYGIYINSDTYPDAPIMDNILIKNNIIRNCSASGMKIYSMKDVSSLNFYNNLFYNNQDGIQVHNNLNIISMSFKNNIFYNNKYSNGNLIRIQNSAFPSKIIFDNNLYYKTVGNMFNIGGKMWEYVNGSIYNFDQFKSTYSHEAHGISSDPLFVNPSLNNFHLQSSSPAINRGVNIGVTKDLDSISRPQDIEYDIGPFEYH